jgi:hypothetical protein
LAEGEKERFENLEGVLRRSPTLVRRTMYWPATRSNSPAPPEITPEKSSTDSKKVSKSK